MQEKSGAKQTIENPLDSVKRRLRTRGKMQTVDLRAKRRLVQNAVDFLTFVLLLLQIGEIGSWPRFLVDVHCTSARVFNEHPNSVSLRTSICNTFIECHPNLLQNIFLCSLNDLVPFLSP